MKEGWGVRGTNRDDAQIRKPTASTIVPSHSERGSGRQAERPVVSRVTAHATERRGQVGLAWGTIARSASFLPGSSYPTDH